MSPSKPSSPIVVTLPNAVRLVALPSPALATATVAVFVRTGSAHEARAQSGISHVVEHMVFKGTATRDARRLNVDAERLGADVNAHTDKDHTAFYLRGLPGHVGEFVDLLADLTLHAAFPEAELERERQVLLQELAEDADDPVSTGYKLFDAACFGHHAAAQPVVGTAGHVERLQRDDLAGYVQRQYTGANLVVGAAGAFDVESFLRRAEAAFAPLSAGTPNVVPLAAYQGDVRTRGQAGSSQSHLLLGGALPSLREALGTAVDAGALAAAVLGEGMSSPLLHELREQRALAYHAACSADLLDMCGQLVIEASTAPERFDECLEATLRLLAAHAERIDADELLRARRQLTVKRLRHEDKPLQRIEGAAIDLFVHGRVREMPERLAALEQVDAEAVRRVFEHLILQGPSLAVTGHVKRGTGARSRQRLDALRRG
jgi:predicted Zn-dependent peptidase